MDEVNPVTSIKIDYIEPLQGYKVDLEKLVKEYDSVKHLLKDNKPKHSYLSLPVKALPLVQGNISTDIIKSLPYTFEITTELRNKYVFNTVAYRCVMPQTCYDWHVDWGEITLHIPLITNEGCRFVYENKSFYMPADGTIYIINNEKYHSFMNAGREPRIHLTIDNYVTKPLR